MIDPVKINKPFKKSKKKYPQKLTANHSFMDNGRDFKKPTLHSYNYCNHFKSNFQFWKKERITFPGMNILWV